MGWGITFTPELYLSKFSFQSIYELQGRIREEEETITYIEKRILMIAASNPKDICGEEFKEEPLSFIQSEVSDLLRDYEEGIQLLIKLRMFETHLEETGEDIEKYNPFKDEKY